jgi:hypothetical protein
MLAAWQGNRLGIWPISGGNLGLTKVYAGVTVPGPISWRPDGSAIAFLISEGTCPLGETDLGRLDLLEMLPIIILRRRDLSFADLVWDAPNRVSLTDEKGGRWVASSHYLWRIAPALRAVFLSRQSRCETIASYSGATLPGGRCRGRCASASIMGGRRAATPSAVNSDCGRLSPNYRRHGQSTSGGASPYKICVSALRLTSGGGGRVEGSMERWAPRLSGS